MFKVSFSGLVFEEEKRLQNVQKAFNDVLEYGTDLIAQRTPVKSGMLQDGWQFDQESIFNDISYTDYVENGTKKMEARNMVKNSLPDIEEYLLRRLVKVLEN